MIPNRRAAYWRILKKIFFVIFVLHTLWFIIFLVQQFNNSGFPIEKLKTKVLLVLAVALAGGLIYYFWLRKIAAVKRVAIVLREIFFICYISSFLYLLLGLIFNPPVTLTQLMSLVKGHGLKRDYVSYSEMNDNVKLAVIASEDQLFPDHDGFDLKAIKKAIKYNARHTSRQRGASTLSQQTAKNVFLWQGGGFFRKGLEVYFTFSIEKFWGKERILERYLNVAEMGPGIFGVQAAARAYFNKDAKDLTRIEAAQIAACLPNPKRLSVKPLSGYVASRANAIVGQMNNLAGDPDVQALLR